MKRIKMALYGEPGVGKSTFVSQAEKPFFICTDGNYEWLEEFGADPDAHINVSSWEEIKKLINNPSAFDGYETIVIDLLEDAFKWCEYEYCVRSKVDHVSDVGYGKGYDISRNEFFVEISKLLSLDKNVVLIMHGLTYTVKDRRGVEHTRYAPSSRIPDKVLDMIEGRVRYFLRCYLKDEEQKDGTLIKKRVLSIVPKPDEFGIARGLNENSVPHDIPLDWKTFANVIGLTTEEKVEEVKHKRKRAEAQTESVPEPVIETAKAEPVNEISSEDAQLTIDDVPFDMLSPVVKAPEQKPEPAPQHTPAPTPAPSPVQSNADKLASIKAKLAALKK